MVEDAFGLRWGWRQEATFTVQVRQTWTNTVSIKGFGKSLNVTSTNLGNLANIEAKEEELFVAWVIGWMLLQFSTMRNTIQETDMDRWISELQRTPTSKTIRSEERISNPNDACTEVDKEKR